MKYDYVVIIHRLYTNGQIKKGGLDLVIDFLSKKGSKILLIEFPLDYKQTDIVSVSSIIDNKISIIESSKMFIKIPIICWVLEFFLSLTILFRYAGTGGVIITSDPLTTLPALLFRKVGFFRFHYYHSVDYSTDRFKNKILNRIYVNLLKKGLRNADLVGIVTKYAAERLSSLGVKQTVYLPNSMDYHSLDYVRKPIGKRISHSMVITCSNVSHKYLIHELIALVKTLKPFYGDIVLNVVGKFDEKDVYCKELLKYTHENDLTENVMFYGQINREENYKVISTAQVGLAFYDGKHSHVMFGDALKIREYAALGVPTVADSHTTTAVEMNESGCGFTVDNFDVAAEKIQELFNDPSLYNRCSEASLVWSRKYDKRKMLENLYKRYLR